MDSGLCLEGSLQFEACQDLGNDGRWADEAAGKGEIYTIREDVGRRPLSLEECLIYDEDGYLEMLQQHYHLLFLFFYCFVDTTPLILFALLSTRVCCLGLWLGILVSQLRSY